MEDYDKNVETKNHRDEYQSYEGEYGGIIKMKLFDEILT